MPPTHDTHALGALHDAWLGDPSAGRPDWTRLRAWLDAIAAASPAARQQAVAHRPPGAPSAVLDNLLAAIAEKVSDDATLPRPGWTTDVPVLEAEWCEVATERMRRAWRLSTPPQLAARNLTVDAASLWRPTRWGGPPG